MTKWHFFGNLSTSDNTAQQPSLIRSMSNALKLHGGMYETGIVDLIYSFQSIFPDRVSQIWPDTHSGIKTLGEHFSLKGCKWVGWSQAWKCKCLNLTFIENCLRNTSVWTQCTSPLLGFKEGIRERDFISVLKEGIVHIIRVNVEKDWHVNLKKFVKYPNTQSW